MRGLFLRVSCVRELDLEIALFGENLTHFVDARAQLTLNHRLCRAFGGELGAQRRDLATKSFKFAGTVVFGWTGHALEGAFGAVRRGSARTRRRDANAS